MTFNCDNTFEGAGWLRVRYVSYASWAPRWFQSRDGLRGSDEYGYVTDGEYSIYYKNLLKPDNEMLFVIGLRSLCLMCTLSTLTYSLRQDPRG